MQTAAIQSSECTRSHIEIDIIGRSVNKGMPLSDQLSSDETPSQQLYSFFRRNLNFYRLHILYLFVVRHLCIEA
jgi:hypothetical protein